MHGVSTVAAGALAEAYAACEALAPHLCHVGLSTADPSKRVPIGFWMHRTCVPFINPQTFQNFVLTIENLFLLVFLR